MNQGYEFHQWRIRPDMLKSLELYRDYGFPPSGFLEAVLKNDLVEACNQADDDNLANIQAYAAYMYCALPRAIWGSKEAIDRWVAECYKNINGQEHE